ncbi:MFS transporter [Methylobacter sp. Wu8]|uniref:MFS transporter n=1 Tax=Methylobacter sp. Wu8 TaxID=3118457 RepID=UPI002F2F451D
MNPQLKFFLVAMVTVSVISDSMLIPFYPQFFAAAFSITAPQHIGLYLSASCFVVMLAFPLWAAAAKHMPVLRLLIYTQFAAGVLSILCYESGSLPEFWFVSLLMMVFKASYLLIYPFVMSLEHKDKHGGTIGLLSVIVHLGAIAGAGIGGFALDLFEPRLIFLLMSVGDFLQMLVCAFLLGKDKTDAEASPEAPQYTAEQAAEVLTGSLVYKLGLVMLLFYFSVYLIRPFFSRYWEAVSAWNGGIVTGLVFAIPGAIALLALCINKNMRSSKHGIVSAALLGMFGLLLQASGQQAIVLLGRCLFGWALFQATVRLDLLLFEVSTPASYAADFSKIYFFQSLGALIASYTAGSLVAAQGLQMPFIAGALGLVLTAFLYALLFKAAPKPMNAVMETS